MLLERLAEYGQRIAEEDGEERLPPMYQRVPIRYIIKLDREGRLRGVPHTLTDTSTTESKRGKIEVAPTRIRTSGVVPKLLVDTGVYTFGKGREGDKAERVIQQHSAYVELIGRCARETREPAVEAVCNYLSTLNLDDLAFPDEFDPAENITFDVDGMYPMRLPSVQRFWAREASATDEDAQPAQCLVCGQSRSIAKMLPVLIKGIPGGQPTGMVLVSANAGAFESYGLAVTAVAPICEPCGLLVCNALNRLLNQPDTRLRTPNLAYVFWTREPTATGWGTLLSDAKPDDVRSFLASFQQGKASAMNLDPISFYAATLSAANARVVVRDWIETTLGNAQRNLRRYFQMQRLKDFSGEDRYFPLWQLLAATKNAHSHREEAAPQVGQALMRTALHGDSLPEWLLYQVVRRTRAEQEVRSAHAALIKMVMLSQQMHGDEDVNEQNDLSALDQSRPEPAYHCGRLFAELEAIQRRALGDINQTIADRFYGTASSAPASVFARLIRGAQPHLSKMRRDETWLYERFEQRLEEISGHIGDFPKVLTLRQQGLFALGYYHQRAANAEEIRQAVERKKQRALAEAELASWASDERLEASGGISGEYVT